MPQKILVNKPITSYCVGMSKIDFLFLFSIFIFSFYFFTSIHPLYIFDTDDWINMAMWRTLYPSTVNYNLSKILPEVLFPLVSLFSIKILYPIIDDYVITLNIGIAFFYSVIITFYFATVYQFLKQKVSFFETITEKQEVKDKTLAIFLLLLFVFLHFSSTVLRLSVNDNFLLQASNVNCIFHYSIPALLNITLVLFFMLDEQRNSEFWYSKNYYTKALMLLFIYCCIFSNLLTNITLVSYASVTVLFNVYKQHKYCSVNKTRSSFTSFAKNNFLNFTIILFFVISAFLEAKGRRALDVGNTNHIDIASIYNSLHYFFSHTIYTFGKGIIKYSLFIILLSNLVGLYFIKRSKNENTQKCIKSFYKTELKLLVIILMIMFLQICITVKAGVGYQNIMSSILCWYSIFLLLTGISTIYLVSHFKKLKVIIPISIVYLFAWQILYTPPFREINAIPYVRLENVKNYTNDLVKKIVEADNQGIESIEVHVPKFNGITSNFPMAVYSNNVFNYTLYKQGLIKKIVKITIIPDIEINKKYKIPVNTGEQYVAK